MSAIGFDIGGTSSRAGVLERAGRLTNLLKVPTPPTLNELVDWIADTSRRWACEDLSIATAGIALPGIVEPSSGTCVRCVNLPWLEGQPVADLLERKIGRRPLLMTDAQAATWGEYVAAGTPREPFAHLRLGTGIACGVVIEGKLLPTDAARRTHWPVLVADDSPAAPPCPCGLRGCLERLAGGKALNEMARHLGLADLHEVSLNCMEHPQAASLVEQTSRFVARAMANLQSTFGVQTVVLGGGVIEVLPQIFQRVGELCEAAGTCVRIPTLGDDAGMIGAAQLARDATLSAEFPIN